MISSWTHAKLCGKDVFMWSLTRSIQLEWWLEYQWCTTPHLSSLSCAHCVLHSFGMQHAPHSNNWRNINHHWIVFLLLIVGMQQCAELMRQVNPNKSELLPSSFNSLLRSSQFIVFFYFYISQRDNIVPSHRSLNATFWFLITNPINNDYPRMVNRNA